MKCDEARPFCLRCTRLNRVCKGYVQDAPVQSPEDDSPACQEQTRVLIPKTVAIMPWTRALQPRTATRDLEQIQLSRLACAVLVTDPQRDANGLQSFLWSTYLPQCCYSIPLVSAAASALGACYASTQLKMQSPTQNSVALKHYHKAIRLLRQDLRHINYGPMPLLMACVLLTAVEALNRNLLGALMHLKGVYHVLLPSTSSDSSRSLRDSPVPQIDSLHVGSPFDQACTAGEDLIDLFRNLDVQTVTYSERYYLLSLAPGPAQCPSVTFSDLKNGCSILLDLVHSSYHFIASASEHKYRRTGWSDMTIEQCRHISWLHSWLNCFDRMIRGEGSCEESKLSDLELCRALVLKSRCLSTLIHVSTILDAYQTSYDKFAPQFADIIDCARKVLGMNSPTSTRSKYADGVLPHFSLCPGIIQPLVLTARNYRHSRLRREALSLLRYAGIEGPWIGAMDAAVARRVIEVEEQAFRNSLAPSSAVEQSSGEILILPSDIKEQDRICDYTILDETLCGGLVSEVKFSMTRCLGVDSIMAGEKTADDPSCWSTWEERVAVDAKMANPSV